MPIHLRRAYEPAHPGDGRRYLVDRLWPRGLSSTALALTDWRRDLAPSDELRRWYGHDPARFAEFRVRYRRELRAKAPAIQEIRELAKRETITLVFAARDPERSNVAVLAEYLSAPTVRGGRKRTPPRTIPR